MSSSLGRGISSFLPEISEDATTSSVDINLIVPNKYQPRKHFDEDAIRSLSESIKEKGVIQPLIVRDLNDGKYELIAGERRLRASKIAGLETVPVVVKQMTDDESLEIAILENIQREDLNPLEEAEGYKRLIGEFSKTQEDIAKMTGKSRSHIANMLRLLTLDESVKEKLLTNQITAGHAKVLVGVKNPEAILEKIISENLNVRQTEKIISDMKSHVDGANESLITGKDHSDSILDEFASEIDEHENSVHSKKFPRVKTSEEEFENVDALNEHDALSQQLSKILRTNVKIHLKGEHGAMLIYFDNLSELDRLLKQIMNSDI